MTDVWCTCVCCFPRPPTSAHPAGINYTQTPPLPSTKTKKHSLFKAHWMIYTCASPVGVDLRDGRPALEDRGLSFSSAAILLMDAGDARPFLSLPTFVSTGDCPWNADVLMAQQREPRSAPSSCSSVAGFTKCVPVPHDPNGRSVFFLREPHSHLGYHHEAQTREHFLEREQASFQVYFEIFSSPELVFFGSVRLLGNTKRLIFLPVILLLMLLRSHFVPFLKEKFRAGMLLTITGYAHRYRQI